jgi:DNA/RNA endonuclease G (NUC1)
MTRREDPVWGTENAKMRGNADSMPVTNATPQMQSFNAPVWLALEDHALKHAQEDKMRISVFTGPILKSTDPVKFGVKVPVEFWKVIAFIHDEDRRADCDSEFPAGLLLSNSVPFNLNATSGQGCLSKNYKQPRPLIPYFLFT